MKNRYVCNRFLMGIMAVASMILFTACNSSELNPDDYIELGQYKGLQVERAVHVVTEEEIEDELYTLASSYATEEEISSGKIQNGDVANIDYEGKLNGVAFEGGTSAGYNLEIGSGTFINGFEDGLIGVEIGDTVDLDLTFPENYGNSELAGQAVVFTVKVNSAKRKNIPEVTDEFIVEISDGKFKDLDDYTEALEEVIVAEYEEYNDLQYYEDLWNLAVDNATVKKEFPSELINEKTSRMVVNAQKYASSYGVSFNDFVEKYMNMSSSEFYTNAAEYAQKAAKESMVLKAIAKKENITVSQEEIDKAVNDYVDAGAYESAEEFMTNNNMGDLEEYVLLSKVEDFLAEYAVGQND